MNEWKNYWANWEIRRMRKLLKVKKETIDPNGFIRPHFDFLSSEPYGNVMRKLLQYCRSKGMNEGDIARHWSEATGMQMKDVKLALRGELAIPAWEFFLALKKFKVKLDIRMEDETDAKFSSEIMESTLGTKLMIKCDGYIKYVLIINLDDYDEWDIVFKKGWIEPKVDKYKAEFRKGLEWYFLKQAKKKKYPFNIIAKSMEFHARWVKKEIKFEN